MPADPRTPDADNMLRIIKHWLREHDTPELHVPVGDRTLTFWRITGQRRGQRVEGAQWEGDAARVLWASPEFESLRRLDAILEDAHARRHD